MNPRELFESNLGTIERVIAIVCRRGQLFGEDAEDFASQAKMALIEDDYAILRKYEGRSSLDTYLTVVVQRLLADERTRAKGRWHPSSDAKRLGPAAVLLETLVRRDGRSLDEALPHMRVSHPELTREQVAAMLDRLPQRITRPRPVDLNSVGEIAGSEPADARVLAGDRQRMASLIGRALREQLRSLPAEDRLLIRLRFAADMSIADISRMTRLPQRPLYRRLEALFVRLRSALAEAGVDRATVAGLLGRDGEVEIDFGLANGKSELGGQSIQGTAERP
jgi:RNA polymerase sigma factor (sigma-70 family)